MSDKSDTPRTDKARSTNEYHKICGELERDLQSMTARAEKAEDSLAFIAKTYPTLDEVTAELHKTQKNLARCESVGEIKTARIRSLEGEVEELRKGCVRSGY